jgi:hypothetical protein
MLLMKNGLLIPNSGKYATIIELLYSKKLPKLSNLILIKEISLLKNSKKNTPPLKPLK